MNRFARALAVSLLGAGVVVGCELFTTGDYQLAPDASSDAAPTDDAPPVDADGGDGALDGTISPSFAPAEVFQEGLSRLTDVAADGISVYWIDGALSGVARYGPIDGGVGVEAVVSGRIEPLRLFVDATNVYWTETYPACAPTHTLRMIPKVGGAHTQLSGTCYETIYDVAQDPLNFVLSKGSNGSALVRSVAKQGAADVPFATGLADVGAVATTPAYAYWARPSLGTIERAPRPNGEGELFASGQTAQALAADDTHLYWTNGVGTVVRLAHASPGAAPETLVSGESAPTRIVLDDAWMYWIASGNGQVRGAPKSGGAAITLSGATGIAVGLAVDARGVYWTSPSDGRVYVARKN